MLAIVATSFTDPSKYELQDVLPPIVEQPDDVMIKVYSASINPVDVKLAAGAFKLALSETFPLRIGYDCAGVVSAVGEAVKDFRVGDEVWSRLPEVGKGSLGEYVSCPARYIAHKPKNLTFAEAASLPLAALTSLQALQKYKGPLDGKTVFVPAGLGGTGAFACQLAKNVFRAGKVITTVSTAKVPMVSKYLGDGVVDQIVDYTKEDPVKVIPRGSVDFILDTMGDAMSYLSLMTPSTGTIISISTAPSGTQLQAAGFFKRPSNPRLPAVPRLFLDSADYIRKLRAWRWRVNYSYMFLEADCKALDDLRIHVGAKNVRPVIGSNTDLRDLDGVREICLQVYKGKGGIGKAVINVQRS